MKPAPFSVSGAIAAQSAAHDEMQRAIDSGKVWRVLINGKPYVSCASLRAAQLFVGKSKRYTIEGPSNG